MPIIKSVRFLGGVRMNGQYDLVNITNPGPDGISGTADDSTIPFYQWTNYAVPAEYVITNPTKGMSSTMLDDPKRTQKGFEIIFQKRMSNRWQLHASYTYGITRGNSDELVISNLGLDPNQFTNAYGPYWGWGEPHHFRLQGNVILPLDISFGINASWMSGRGEYANAYFMTPSGITIVKTKKTGDAWKYPNRKNVDMRLEKRVSIGKEKTLTLMADIFNVLNSGNPAARWRTYGTLYGKIWYLQDPRTFNISARFWF